MDKKLNEVYKNLIPTKLKTTPYGTNSYNTIKHKHIYLITSWPAFTAVNNGYTFHMHLLDYITKGHIAIHTILISI